MDRRRGRGFRSGRAGLLVGGARVNRRRSYSSPEHDHAVALIRWRDLMVVTRPDLAALRHLYHIKNGGNHSAAEGARFKAEGVLAGASDYCLPVFQSDDMECEVFGACYIELKPPEKYLKPHQKDFLLDMQSCGNFAAWGMGWQECAAILEWYLVGFPAGLESPPLRPIIIRRKSK